MNKKEIDNLFLALDHFGAVYMNMNDFNNIITSLREKVVYKSNLCVSTMVKPNHIVVCSHMGKLPLESNNMKLEDFDRLLELKTFW